MSPFIKEEKFLIAFTIFNILFVYSVELFEMLYCVNNGQSINLIKLFEEITLIYKSRGLT
jgi:hypothetical protein